MSICEIPMTHGAAPESQPIPVVEPLDLERFRRLPIRAVAIDALRPGVNIRLEGSRASHVQVLVDAADFAGLPPLLVQQDGWRIIDGAHRWEAAKIRGAETIRVQFLDCTDAEALVLALKSNNSHGLPLSRADRLEGAQQILSEHPTWSDRAIASVANLSAKTIASLRARTADSPVEGAEKRLGLDGRWRPVAAGDGRERAAQYILNNPEASLRQVSRETGVSLGTVHDVSTRLRRGVPAVGPAESGPVAVPTLPEASGVREARVGRVASACEADDLLCWMQVSRRLANDPAIRYSEQGREFLRWMSHHAADGGRWRQLQDAIPPHWVSTLAEVAMSMSVEWAQFAANLGVDAQPRGRRAAS